MSDVWLYNAAETPEVAPWEEEDAEMPFLNPRDYSRDDEKIVRLRDDAEIGYKWSAKGVEVSVEGVPMARLESGSKPGWSRLAKKPGPLAKPLVEGLRT